MIVDLKEQACDEVAKKGECSKKRMVFCFFLSDAPSLPKKEYLDVHARVVARMCAFLWPDSNSSASTIFIDASSFPNNKVI
jgi:hypothetical protein